MIRPLFFSLVSILFSAGYSLAKECSVGAVFYDARAPITTEYRVAGAKGVVSVQSAFKAVAYAANLAEFGKCVVVERDCKIEKLSDNYTVLMYGNRTVYQSPGYTPNNDSGTPDLDHPGEQLSEQDVMSLAAVLRAAGYCSTISRVD